MNHKLRRSALQPPWQDRLKELLLAGGVLGLVGCSTDSASNGRPARDGGGSDGVACGNANPDPCICGRAEASAQGAAACAAKTECERSGRDWMVKDDGSTIVCLPAYVPPQPTETAPSTNPPQTSPTDGGSFDAGSPFGCGNANPDPCICDRPKTSAAAAKACAAETACKTHGGEWTFVGDMTGVRLVCIGYDASFPSPDASIESKP